MAFNKRYLTSLNFVCKIYELGLLVAVVVVSGVNLGGGGYWGNRNESLYLWALISTFLMTVIHLILALVYCLGGSKKAFRIAELVFYIVFTVHHLVVFIVLLTSSGYPYNSSITTLQLLVGFLLGLFIMDIMCKIYEWTPLGSHDYQDPPEKQPQVPTPGPSSRAAPTPDKGTTNPTFTMEDGASKF